MNIVGLMAVADFPMTPDMVEALSWRCNSIILRYDKYKSSKEVLEACIAAAKGKVTTIVTSDLEWNRWNWREDLVRAADKMDPVPDYLFFLDHDEQYGPGFDQDFAMFRAGGFSYMMFDYEMVTCDGRPVMKYPRSPHCKVIKWVPGITYNPYRGYARPRWPTPDGCTVYSATSRIRHFCFYTKELEELKELHF